MSELITRHLQEVVGDVSTVKSVYWGTMPTGSPHVAYFVPMLKIADFLKAGLTVKILVADLHAALDNVPWEKIDARSEYYEAVVKNMLRGIGVDLTRLEFIRGSSFQLSGNYLHDLLKLSTITTEKHAKKAASEVVKQLENPKLSGLIYPLMQALDEEYLHVDAQFGGLDQRKILMFAREYLPKIGYAARVELMNPMLPGLTGEKMSSSVAASKIDVIDDEQTVLSKIKKADFVAGNADNGLMAFAQFVIFTWLLDNNRVFEIKRPEKFGGNAQFESYELLRDAVTSQAVHPLDVKQSVGLYINELLKPMREDSTIKELYSRAYE